MTKEELRKWAIEQAVMLAIPAADVERVAHDLCVFVRRGPLARTIGLLQATTLPQPPEFRLDDLEEMHATGQAPAEHFGGTWGDEHDHP